MPVLLQIAVGGAIGATLRYLAVLEVTRLAGRGFPWGTLLVNIAGGLAMGIVAELVLGRTDHGLARFAPFLMPGVLGGFTTFSAFSLEVVQLAERGRLIAAALYVSASVGLSVAALVAGMRLARGAAGWP